MATKITETIELIEVTTAGLTVSRLIWNRFLRPTNGVMGRIFDLNPGLAAAGTHIPIGTVVRVPVPTNFNEEPVIEMITLWD